MPGPAPKPDGQRRRRNATVAMTQLPTRREGPVPSWPLAGGRPDTWDALWVLPQAVAWERARSERVVARYALLLDKVESGLVALAPEVRQLEDRLGLTPMAMLRLRWEVAADEVAEARADRDKPKATPRPRKASRRRLMAVDGGTKAG